MSQSFSEKFIQYLQNTAEDRGKMAVLRKGLIESQSHLTWPLLFRFMNFDSPYQIKALQTIAGIFAHHPKNTEHGNFGTVCRNLLDAEEMEKIARGESGPISRHFQYALAANGEEIFPRVRRMILRAKRDDINININYIQLTKDLLDWKSSYRKDKIKLKWGKAFWKADTQEETESSESEVSENG